MKYILFIMGIVLWVGISSRKRVRKAISDLEDDAYAQQEPSRPAFESLFVDEDERAEEVPFAKEEAAAGYFTYETEPAAPKFERRAEPSAPIFRADNAIENIPKEGSAATFDLRQAIIYNTILSAKYVSGTNLPEIN